MEKSGRLVRMLLLLQAHGSITAQELAEKLGVSLRTVYRDVEALSLWGIPIFGNAGHGGGYSLPEGYNIDASMFTSNEASILSAGSVAIQGLTDFVEDYKEIEIASAKLLSILSEAERLVVGRHMRYIYCDRSRWYRDYTNTTTLRALKNAVIYNLQVEITYHEVHEDAKTHQIKDRSESALVDPYGLVYKSDTWYLVGYSYSEKKLRRWNLTRVDQAQVMQKEFFRPPDFSLTQWWEEELEEFGKGNTKVLMRIDKRALSRFARFHWKKDNRFFDMDTYILVEMFVDKYEWHVIRLEAFLASYNETYPLSLEEQMALNNIGVSACLHSTYFLSHYHLGNRSPYQLEKCQDIEEWFWWANHADVMQEVIFRSCQT